MPAGVTNRFGGEWTEQKLEILRKYLSAYTTALSKQSFRKTYIDGFAGTGLRELRGAAPNQSNLLDEEPARFLEGSARIALKTNPPFNQYIFVEKDPARFAALENLKSEFPALAGSIKARNEDANEYLQKICEGQWKHDRAVLFLDPYGMQVKWKTIEAIARTQAIDLWLLFPLGVGVNRMLTQTGEIPDSWQQTLDEMLGTPAWRQAFYQVVKDVTLFGMEERLEKASLNVIANFFLDQLRRVFAKVADNPFLLKNSKASPLYLFCFAAGNPRGAEPAVKIAGDILRKMGS